MGRQGGRETDWNCRDNFLKLGQKCAKINHLWQYSRSNVNCCQNARWRKYQVKGSKPVIFLSMFSRNNSSTWKGWANVFPEVAVHFRPGPIRGHTKTPIDSCCVLAWNQLLAMQSNIDQCILETDTDWCFEGSFSLFSGMLRCDGAISHTNSIFLQLKWQNHHNKNKKTFSFTWI